MKISVKVIANSSFNKVIEDEIDLFGNRANPREVVYGIVQLVYLRFAT